MTQIIKQVKTDVTINDIFSCYKDEKNAVFLDSSLQNQYGAYSIIGIHPYLTLENKECLYVNGLKTEETFEDFLKAYLEQHQEKNHTGLPLISGGIGYFSYDYGRHLEKIISRHPKTLDIPLCIFNFYDDFIIENHKTQELWLIANGHLQTPKAAIREMEVKIAAATPQFYEKTAEKKIKVIPNFTKEEYMAAVDAVINYIVEGDVYIANMTQHLTIESEKRPYEVFQKLRTINPAPFGGYLNYETFQIVCASPERFMKMQDREIETRPIKGTRKRGDTPNEDNALKEELRQSGKDQSELLMIVDLERNDLNKVCIPGSVKVTELFEIEAYATVFHLVATIVGRLAPSLNAADLIYATFPGGSITGAPKIRAMEIIDELEHLRRNIYTGSLGYIGLDGNMDMNITIRTTLFQGNAYYLGVGGGITFESDLAFEYEETLQKAKAILEAMK